MNARQVLYPNSLIPHPTQGLKGSQLPQTARINREHSSCLGLGDESGFMREMSFTGHRDALSSLLQPINTVPQDVVTPNHKIILLLLHNCHFAVGMKHSIHM